jgi:hypothetical protein
MVQRPIASQPRQVVGQGPLFHNLGDIAAQEDEPVWSDRHAPDTWTGLGLVVVVVERQGPRLSLSHIGEDEWRVYFMSSPLFAPEGFGVAKTPWQAVARAAWAAVAKPTGTPSSDSLR